MANKNKGNTPLQNAEIIGAGILGAAAATAVAMKLDPELKGKVEKKVEDVKKEVEEKVEEGRDMVSDKVEEAKVKMDKVSSKGV